MRRNNTNCNARSTLTSCMAYLRTDSVVYPHVGYTQAALDAPPSLPPSWVRSPLLPPPLSFTDNITSTPPVVLSPNRTLGILHAMRSLRRGTILQLKQCATVVSRPCGLHHGLSHYGRNIRSPAPPENGPFFINDDGEVEERQYAWDVTANIIFVDNPINVGYSYSDDPRDRVFNESVLAADLLDFLEEFLAGAASLERLGLGPSSNGTRSRLDAKYSGTRVITMQSTSPVVMKCGLRYADAR